MQQQFEARTATCNYPRMPGCIAAMDATHIELHDEPSIDPATPHNLKKFPSINVLAV
jgi:hypothetical protein